MRKLLLLILGLALSSCPAWAQAADAHPDFLEALRTTANMVRDSEMQKMIGTQGLSLVNVTWEDTGRYKGSAVGPNISDMTLQVQSRDPTSDQKVLTLLPVLRYPNFSDQTADVSLDKLHILVGNESGKDLRRIGLKEFLENPKNFMSSPETWQGPKNSLLAERDTHALVSAQACFLPIPPKGKVEFNPALFNYQSQPGNPAVLTILATREGTSLTVIDNSRDAAVMGPHFGGQRLFFNKNGQRAALTGERLSDFKEKGGTSVSPAPSTGSAESLNMVMLIQVPLKHRSFLRDQPAMTTEGTGALTLTRSAKSSDLEDAVIGHGLVQGPFRETVGTELERDERFPVRVTVQFYQASSNGVVEPKDLKRLKAQIDRVYKDGDYVGSLVVSGETSRPTEYEGPKTPPKNWWTDFWKSIDDKDWTIPERP